jgi:hypothetical protein
VTLRDENNRTAAQLAAYWDRRDLCPLLNTTTASSNNYPIKNINTTIDDCANNNDIKYSTSNGSIVSKETKINNINNAKIANIEDDVTTQRDNVPFETSDGTLPVIQDNRTGDQQNTASFKADQERTRKRSTGYLEVIENFSRDHQKLLHVYVRKGEGDVLRELLGRPEVDVNGLDEHNKAACGVKVGLARETSELGYNHR